MDVPSPRDVTQWLQAWSEGDQRALEQLTQLDSRKSQVVELRFFGGLSVEETAEVLKVCPDTVMRDWKMAKLCLGRELRNSAAA